tara:strand:+ start:324 stop:908 length:585 start_codon:yes stop_codon:yes gene_type:complete
MKQLKLKDILPKIEIPLTKLSVYYEGQWVFATLKTPTSTTSTQDFYLISYDFGLVQKNETLPSKKIFNGKAGSYVIKDADGSLTMATPEQYDRVFPRNIIDPPILPTTSMLLKDPKYLTNIVRKSRNEASNTIQVGSSTFKNTEAKKTIVILPSGKQAAVLIKEPHDPFDSTPATDDTEPLTYGGTVRITHPNY